MNPVISGPDAFSVGASERPFASPAGASRSASNRGSDGAVVGLRQFAPKVCVEDSRHHSVDAVGCGICRAGRIKSWLAKRRRRDHMATTRAVSPVPIYNGAAVRGTSSPCALQQSLRLSNDFCDSGQVGVDNGSMRWQDAGTASAGLTFCADLGIIRLTGRGLGQIWNAGCAGDLRQFRLMPMPAAYARLPARRLPTANWAGTGAIEGLHLLRYPAWSSCSALLRASPA